MEIKFITDQKLSIENQITLSYEFEWEVKRAIRLHNELGLSGKQKSQLEGILKTLEKKRSYKEEKLDRELAEQKAEAIYEEEKLDLQHSKYYM